MRALTSAVANKMLRKLKEEKEYLLTTEEKSCTYIEVNGFPPEIPSYDFESTSKRIIEIDKQVRRIKHALNVFNTTTKLENNDMTIDEALVYMAQLNKHLEKLDEMRKRLPKERKRDVYGRDSNLVEYVCTNYDKISVEDAYNDCAARIASIQLDLDSANQTKVFEVDL